MDMPHARLLLKSLVHRHARRGAEAASFARDLAEDGVD
jgi:hypothetical protein